MFLKYILVLPWWISLSYLLFSWKLISVVFVFVVYISSIWIACAFPCLPFTAFFLLLLGPVTHHAWQFFISCQILYMKYYSVFMCCSVLPERFRFPLGRRLEHRQIASCWPVTEITWRGIGFSEGFGLPLPSRMSLFKSGPWNPGVYPCPPSSVGCKCQFLFGFVRLLHILLLLWSHLAVSSSFSWTLTCAAAKEACFFRGKVQLKDAFTFLRFPFWLFWVPQVLAVSVVLKPDYFLSVPVILSKISQKPEILFSFWPFGPMLLGNQLMFQKERWQSLLGSQRWLCLPSGLLIPLLRSWLWFHFFLFLFFQV